MYTLFDFLVHVCCLIGAWLAGKYGYAQFGWWGALGGIALGLIAGLVIGRLPLVATLALVRAWTYCDMRLSSTDALKTRLESNYLTAPQLIAELIRRGEAPEQFRAYVAGLLQSESPDKRPFGTACARAWFPDLLDAGTAAASAS
jgi:ribose/xylose/arabinose/galactoside ABC-type transport system permease subunit